MSPRGEVDGAVDVEEPSIWEHNKMYVDHHVAVYQDLLVDVTILNGLLYVVHDACFISASVALLVVLLLGSTITRSVSIFPR